MGVVNKLPAWLLTAVLAVSGWFIMDKLNTIDKAISKIPELVTDLRVVVQSLNDHKELDDRREQSIVFRLNKLESTPPILRRP